MPWLEKAATKYRLGPQGFAIVAAIHKVESDFGRSSLPGVRSGTNSAGAAGPGQFLFSTWATYGVDATGNGRPDIYSIPDSVFATANYLHASGAPGDWPAAIFAYNHAEWYVEEVLETARGFGATEVCTASASRNSANCPPGAWLGWNMWPNGSKRAVSTTAGVAATRRSPVPPRHYCWAQMPRSSAPAKRASTAPAPCAGCLVLSGYPDPGGLVSNDFGGPLSIGPRRHVTIWSNVDHVFLEINGRDWGTSDGQLRPRPGLRPRSRPLGFVPSHPPGPDRRGCCK